MKCSVFTWVCLLWTPSLNYQQMFDVEGGPVGRSDVKGRRGSASVLVFWLKTGYLTGFTRLHYLRLRFRPGICEGTCWGLTEKVRWLIYLLRDFGILLTSVIDPPRTQGYCSVPPLVVSSQWIGPSGYYPVTYSFCIWNKTFRSFTYWINTVVNRMRLIMFSVRF